MGRNAAIKAGILEGSIGFFVGGLAAGVIKPRRLCSGCSEVFISDASTGDDDGEGSPVGVCGSATLPEAVRKPMLVNNFFSASVM
ncbi:MAG: hypothetical protein A2X77_03220 [Gammaproteobacteria bacterium GWE2_42_36]|nr:MAG: hypothetical protein A2X77_03220 [Gammaproteobacteria bacterium GWE2_42_36]HCU05100.1 hypothetical protein [Coxiellaceae bacterium]